MQKIKILLRLIRNRHKAGFKDMSQCFAFYLQINPFFNIFFAKLFEMSAKQGSSMASLCRFLLKNNVGFGSLRHLSPEVRIAFRENVLNIRPVPNGDQKSANARVLNEVATRGYSKVGNVFDQKKVDQAKEYFGKCPTYDAQIVAQSNFEPLRIDWRTLTEKSPYRYLCFQKEDSLRFFKDLGDFNLDALKKIADVYCGIDTVLYGMNTFSTLPGEGAGYAMRVHRDYDDFSCLTFFIAWTKTSEKDGATLFVPYSHLDSKALGPLISLDAEAGDIFAVDTFGLHAGNAQVIHPRLATWIRFGHQENLATNQDGD